MIHGLDTSCQVRSNFSIVGALTFISNGAGPIWWSFAAVRIFATKQSGGDGGGGYLDWIGWSTLLHGIGMVFLLGVGIVLWTHLFIWTVFSPKFLFQAASLIFWLRPLGAFCVSL